MVLPILQSLRGLVLSRLVLSLQRRNCVTCRHVCVRVYQSTHDVYVVYSSVDLNKPRQRASFLLRMMIECAVNAPSQLLLIATREHPVMEDTACPE